MIRTTGLLAVLVLVLPVHPVAAADAAPATAPPPLRLVLDGEIGPAYVVLNDGRYGAGGTRFGAGELGQQRNLVLGGRMSLEIGIGRRHTVILLYAPFDLVTRVTLPKDLVFRGHTLRAGTVVDAGYLFDGYRASYLYRAVDTGPFELGVGASLQVRNAAVSFATADGSYADVEPDIGLVFALKVRARYRAASGLFVILEADGISSFGIASVSGALYDAALTFGGTVATGADVFVRVRLLGGGADVPRREIYNWGDFVFVTAGLRVDLGAVLTRSRRSPSPG